MCGYVRLAMRKLGYSHFLMELPPECYGKGYDKRKKMCKFCSFNEQCSKIEKPLDRVC